MSKSEIKFERDGKKAVYDCDELSGQVLALLESSDRSGFDASLSTGEISRRLDADRRKCLYRLNEHLEPAGLVREVSLNVEQAKRWEITEGGSEVVVAQDLDVYSSLEELVYELEDEVETAVSEAESAKDSVQSYRQKLYRLKDRVEELEDMNERVGGEVPNVEYVRSKHNELADELDAFDERVSGIEEDVERLESLLWELDEKLDKTHSEASERMEKVRELEAKLKALDERLVEEENSFF